MEIPGLRQPLADWGMADAVALGVAIAGMLERCTQAVDTGTAVP